MPALACVNPHATGLSSSLGRSTSALISCTLYQRTSMLGTARRFDPRVWRPRSLQNCHHPVGPATSCSCCSLLKQLRHCRLNCHFAAKTTGCNACQSGASTCPKQQALFGCCYTPLAGNPPLPRIQALASRSSSSLTQRHLTTATRWHLHCWLFAPP